MKELDQHLKAGMPLPIEQMLQIDKIVDVDEHTIVCQQKISEDHWIFPLHFPNDPIFPGSLLIEAAAQCVAIWGWNSGLCGKFRLVKCTAEFATPIMPTDKLITYTASVSKRRNICFGTIEISVDSKTVGTVTANVVVIPN
jgi:3-hydroxymyristoyl/3-hydroxydecanoyl-(acyl carrier protein) dehydratase